MTILEAIKEILKAEGSLTAKDIYDKIVSKNLYSFGAKNPKGVVAGKLRMHCLGIDFPTASPIKLFKLASYNGKIMKFTLIDNIDNEKLITVKQKDIEKSDFSTVEKILFEYEAHRKDIEKVLLEKILKNSPDFFEQLVVDLLLKMGYGYGKDSGIVTGCSHDGGIDGIIYEDNLGLDKIYLQAKRYAEGRTVPIKEIYAFAGSMKAVQKGVFITTSSFSKSAYEYLRDNSTKSIRLIDGQELTMLMVKYFLGVQKDKEIFIYKLDTDYFVE